MNFNELRCELEKRGKESLHTLLQEHPNNRIPGKACEPIKDTDDVDRTRTSYHDRQMETIFGRVELSREGYGQKGCENLHSLDAKLNTSLKCFD